MGAQGISLEKKIRQYENTGQALSTTKQVEQEQIRKTQTPGGEDKWSKIRISNMTRGY